MATPGELIVAMARVLGLSEGTVFQFDRQLAEGGLRSKSGRGSSAAQVTPEDAANLLLAIVAAPGAGPGAKEAARTCEIYGSLPSLASASARKRFANVGLPRLAKLPAKHTLRTALTAVLDGAAHGEEFGVPDKGKLFAADAMFGITFAGPDPWADIVGDGTVGDQHGEPENFARIVYSRHTPGERRRQIQPDLQYQRIVSFRTVREISRVLVKGN